MRVYKHVYVLCQAWDYEGEAVVGVFGSLAEARAAGLELDYCDEVLVYSIPLGGEARLRDPVWRSLIETRVQEEA